MISFKSRIIFKISSYLRINCVSSKCISDQMKYHMLKGRIKMATPSLLLSET